MQLRSLRRTFSGTQLKFWIGLILHMLHYKMACIHSLFWLMTTPLHPQITHKPCIISFAYFVKREEHAQKRSSFSPPQLVSADIDCTLEYLLKSSDLSSTFARFTVRSFWSGGWSQHSWRWDNISNNYAGHFSIFYLIWSRTLMPRKLRRGVDVFAPVVFSPCPQFSSLTIYLLSSFP